MSDYHGMARNRRLFFSKKVDARFLRILNAHQELKRRQDGCLLAWAARSVDGQPLFLVQTLYKSRNHLKEVSRLVSEKLDPEHGR